VWFDQATFSYDADYNKGQSLCLVVSARCDDGRVEKILLPVGDGWEAAPGGQEIRREDGNNTRRVQKQSAYGQFIQSVVDLSGVNPGLLQHLESHPEGPKQTAMWIGMGLHVIRKEEKYTIPDRQTGVVTERITQRLIADAFLGVAGQAANVPAPAPAPVAPGQPASTAPLPVPAAAPLAPTPAPLQPVAAPGVALTPPPPPPPPAPAQPAVASAPPEVVAALTNIAKTVPDHGTWMVQAFAVPGVMGNGALEQGITDQSDLGLFLRLRAS